MLDGFKYKTLEIHGLSCISNDRTNDFGAPNFNGTVLVAFVINLIAPLVFFLVTFLSIHQFYRDTHAKNEETAAVDNDDDINYTSTVFLH